MDFKRLIFTSIFIIVIFLKIIIYCYLLLTRNYPANFYKSVLLDEHKCTIHIKIRHKTLNNI